MVCARMTASTGSSQVARLSASLGNRSDSFRPFLRHGTTLARGEIEKDEFSVDAGEWLEALGSTTLRANPKPMYD